MTGAPGDLASVVADIAGRLPPGHVTAWARVLRPVPSGRAVSTPALEARLLEARPGFAMAGPAARLIAAWQAADPPVSGAAVALALESAAHVAARAEARRGEVVISGPASNSAAVRLTSSAIGELIHDCRESLLVVAADERVALIGSANPTDKALAVNLELGVIIRDPDVVGGMVRHFRVLMDSSSGTLEPFPA